MAGLVSSHVTELYDAEGKDERQEFVWYRTEQHVPSQEVGQLILHEYPRFVLC